MHRKGPSFFAHIRLGNMSNSYKILVHLISSSDVFTLF